jgi:colanic acid/amylovoran biosynthesis glycosyltransferase
MRCDRDLAVILVNYPYSRGEPYFDAELRILCQRFRRVFLLSRHQGNPSDAFIRFDIPENAVVVNVPVPLSRWSRAVTMIRVLLSGEIKGIWRDISHGDGARNLLKFKTAIGYIDFSRRFLPLASDALRHENAEVSSLAWYSYWSDESAYTIAKWKACGIIGSAFSRAHGFDVYESRHPHAYLPFRRFIGTQVTGVACISNHGSNHLQTRDDVTSNTIHIHRLGVIDRDRVATGVRKPFRILTLSNIVPIKNLEAVVAALQGWDEHLLEWHHLGDGPDERYAEQLKLMAAGCANERIRLIFHGFVKPSMVMRTIDSIRPHVLLNTSTFEGIPVSMMEAASIGLPIIGPNVCGVPEIVLHGENGFLIDPNSPKDIRDRLHHMATMPDEQYEAMCRRSQQIQRERFNAERNYREFAEFLANAR